MGLFGSLFDKKVCSICGGDIGLLGNRKLEDGNCCKECASQLSPWIESRRHSTVEEIRNHIAYRRQNAREVAVFNPTRVLGTGMRIYIDEINGRFCLTRARDWRAANPDIIDIRSVLACDIRIDESRREVAPPPQPQPRPQPAPMNGGGRPGSNRPGQPMQRPNAPMNGGRPVPPPPPHYEYSYAFRVTITVSSPYFDRISFELTEKRPDSVHSPLYYEYQTLAAEIQMALNPANYATGAFVQVPLENAAAIEPTPVVEGWTCTCGSVNQGKFCANCGAKRPEDAPVYRCDKCGWVPEDPTNPPKFCPNCGDPFTDDDIQ